MGLELVSKDEIDLSVAKQPLLEENAFVYKGPENRVQARRVKVDRRVMLRFEDVSDRRGGADRRVAQHMWDGRAL